MNTKTDMIIAKGKPITSDVARCKFNTATRKWDVTFNNGKCFHYNRDNVKVIHGSTSLNPMKYRIRHGNQLLGNITAIFSFKDGKNEYWHICFSNGRENDYNLALACGKNLENLTSEAELNEYLQEIVGKQLDALNMACEMMMFSFGKYEIHAQCLTRIICKKDVLVTSLDYQSWDGEKEENNDEWYFVEQNRDKIVGGTVTSVNVNALRDVTIVLDNRISIELVVKNGYHHFDNEQEQWVFFKHHDHSYPFITVYNKSVDIAVDW